MTVMNLILPDNLKGFVEVQMQNRGYASHNDYVCDLIRHDQKRKREQKISALLREGLESGEPVTVDAAYWNARKQPFAAS